MKNVSVKHAATTRIREATTQFIHEIDVVDFQGLLESWVWLRANGGFNIKHTNRTPTPRRK